MIAVEPRVKTLAGQGRLALEVEHGAAFELLISIMALDSEELREAPDIAPSWFDEVRTHIRPATRTAVDRLGGSRGGPWGALIGFALERARAGAIEALVEAVRAADPVELRSDLLGARIPPARSAVHPALFEEVARGDLTNLDDLIRGLTSLDESGDDFAIGTRALAELPVDETPEAVVEALERWSADVLAEREGEIADILRRDAEQKRRLVATTPLDTVVAIATNGLEYRRDPWARRVVLIPHLAFRPWNLINAWADAAIICYPVADETLAAGSGIPPARLVRFHKALGDERRLAMIRRLAHGPATLQELATVAGLAKSSAHHHLVILRAAGLVTVTTDPHAAYALRREPLADAPGWLDRFLATGGAS